MTGLFSFFNTRKYQSKTQDEMTPAITVYKLKSLTAGIEKVVNHNYPYTISNICVPLLALGCKTKRDRSWSLLAGVKASAFYVYSSIKKLDGSSGVQ